MNEREPDDQDRVIERMRDELERDLLHPSRAEVRPRNFPRLFARLPHRTLPLLAGLAIAAGGAGIALASSDGSKDERLEPPELLGVTSASGQRIDFNCEADRQWFFDHIDFSSDLPLQDLPDPLPVPPEGICAGSPSLR